MELNSFFSMGSSGSSASWMAQKKNVVRILDLFLDSRSDLPEYFLNSYLLPVIIVSNLIIAVGGNHLS